MLVDRLRPGASAEDARTVRAHGAKAILARRPSAGLGLAREHVPEVVLLAGRLRPRSSRCWGRLKKHPDTRHVPVVVVGRGAGRAGRRCAPARPRSSRSPPDVVEFDRAMARAARVTDDRARRIASGTEHADLFARSRGCSEAETRSTWQDRAGRRRSSALRADRTMSGSSSSTRATRTALAFLHDRGRTRPCGSFR